MTSHRKLTRADHIKNWWQNELPELKWLAVAAFSAMVVFGLTYVGIKR